jgi:iron complex transport system substrate-binding protein
MNRNHLTIFIGLVLVFSLIIAACTSTISPEITNTLEPVPTATSEPAPMPINITDGLGRFVRLDAPAQAIVSMAPSNTEILFAIGAGPQVVGRDEFSDYPPEAQDIANIGGGFGDYNLEVITSLQPDLILASSLQPPELIQSLEDLGFTVFVLANPTEMEGLFNNLMTVAELTGCEIQAQSLVESLKNRVTAVEKKVAMIDQPLFVFYELDATEPNAPWTAGPGTFVDTLITMAGGVNLGGNLQGEWVQISVEEIVVQDPDVIVLGDYTWGGVTPEDVAARSSWDSLSAVKTGRVYPFDDNLVSRPGPRLVDGLEEMARLLYPDLFE